ncbi:MAG: serine hydrolase [Flavobacteriales bacterium]|jgi:CubicO group peptidase (beta-lactamase class C family)
MHFKRILLCFTLCFPAPLLLEAQDFAVSLGDIQDEYDLAGGAVVLFCEDSLLLSEPFGSAHFEAGIAVTDQTKFRIASISKTITAIAFMQLVDAGLCSLDDDISVLLGYTVRNPNHPDTPITPHMLLSHTSTIIDGGNYDSFLSQTYTALNVPSLEELVSPAGTAYSDALFNNTSPGTYFNYSNLNFGLLGTVIEAVSNERFDVYCTQHILDPLGIDASFRIADLDNLQQLAALYRKQNGQWVIQADDFQDGFPNESYLENYLPGTNALRFAPQGGLRISAVDLATVFRLFLNEGTLNGIAVLSPESSALMMSDSWTYNGNNGNHYYGLFRSWGLGMHRLTNTVNQDVVLTGSDFMIGHPGEAYGLVSDAYIDPERKVGLVFITNGCGDGYATLPGSAFYSVEREVFDLADNALTGSGCEALSLYEDVLNKSSFSTYPVPADQLLQITFQHAGFHLLNIYDVYGKCVWEERVSVDPWKFNCGHLPAGVYAVVVDGIHRRIIIER